MGFSVNNSFLSLSLSLSLSLFFFQKSICNNNLFWNYFRSGIGSAHNKCKKKNVQYSLHRSSDSSLQSRRVSQRWDAWIHFFWFAQANWWSLQVTRWSKESHESWPIVYTNYMSLHNHIDCEGCVSPHARAVSIENLVIWKGSLQLTFKVFIFSLLLYINIYIFFFLWLKLCSYISLEITFVNFLISTEWRSVIFFFLPF